MIWTRKNNQQRKKNWAEKMAVMCLDIFRRYMALFFDDYSQIYYYG